MGKTRKILAVFYHFFLLNKNYQEKSRHHHLMVKNKDGIFFRRLKQKPKIYLSIYEHRKGDQKQRTKIKSINNRYKDLLDLHITYFWCLFRFQKKERYLVIQTHSERSNQTIQSINRSIRLKNYFILLNISWEIYL